MMQKQSSVPIEVLQGILCVYARHSHYLGLRKPPQPLEDERCKNIDSCLVLKHLQQKRLDALLGGCHKQYKDLFWTPVWSCNAVFWEDSPCKGLMGTLVMIQRTPRACQLVFSLLESAVGSGEFPVPHRLALKRRLARLSSITSST